MRLNHLSTKPYSAKFFRKSNNLKDPLNLETKGKICELVHFDPFFWQHVHHTRVVEFSMLFSCVSSLEFISCLGTSKKLSLEV